MSAVLVTGGAGYIGSHTVIGLLQAGHHVTVLDNLYSGFRWAVSPDADFVEGDINDQQKVESIIANNRIDAVMHFAGHIVVPESVSDPIKYFQNNVTGSLNLIQSCKNKGVSRFVFSSSAAVYGNPKQSPATEDSDTAPINPYGRSKLITEWMLEDVAASTPEFNFTALRYFNVAGAHSSGTLGQSTPNATHLIKIACQAAAGLRPDMSVFGDDYETADGTCVRDYIHVEDLAAAHVDALSYLEKQGESTKLNCGYGSGFSVREVIDCVKRVSGVDFTVHTDQRRAGDPASLVADNSKICQVLGWQPKHNDLELICKSAYDWERSLADKQH